MAASILPPDPLAGWPPEPDNPAMPADVVRARDWLRRHPDSEVSLARLAEVAGVRPRTLEAHFREFTGTTPLGFARALRLAQARRRLQEADAETRVTDVALASGFRQFGRFAGLYRRRFGEAPSDTLRRARRGSAAVGGEIDDEALLLTMRAVPAAFAVAPRECNRALADLEEAQQLAPGYGLAKSLAAWCWGQRAAQRFSTTPAEDLARAVRLAEDAITLAPDDSMTLVLAAGAFTLAHRVEAADRLIERSLAHDPLSAIGWMRRGWISTYLGDSENALRELRATLHLAPFEPFRHLTMIGMGCAHFAAGRYDRAIAWTRAGIEAFPQSFWAERVVIAAAIHAGAHTEARRAARRLLRRDPDLTVAAARRAWPFRQDIMDRLCDGLAVAGLPRS